MEKHVGPYSAKRSYVLEKLEVEDVNGVKPSDGVHKAANILIADVKLDTCRNIILDSYLKEVIGNVDIPLVANGTNCISGR